ncbi:MAG: hypothetical protein AAF497_26680 [Planctomycetota bacterium]
MGQSEITNESDLTMPIQCFIAFAEEEDHISLLLKTVASQRTADETFRLGRIEDSDSLADHREMYPKGLIDNENEVVIWSNMSIERLREIMSVTDDLADLNSSLILANDYRGAYSSEL